MEVVSANDHVTHVVMGGKETADMGISSSAAFFHILSSTLYKNQKLAVVRETLCNAWDAHIAAGKEDTPISIKLANGVFIIEDFGLGIDPKEFNNIYGVYGNSTKTGKSNETGGFGLGCKAPFAYTDHFAVTSCFEGVKSIYRLSKSSSEVSGKPSITLITSFPTTESGLKVTIDIKEDDVVEFKKYINDVVYEGDIKAELNGCLLKTINMNTEEGFVVDCYSNLPRIGLRYGNVIYPLERGYTKEYDTTFSMLSDINTWNHTNTNASLILYAQPDTISVTPSRESLSMQQKTINTVKKVLKDFNDKFSKDITKRYREFFEQDVDSVIANKSIGKLLNIYELPMVQDDNEELLFSKNRADTFVDLQRMYYYSRMRSNSRKTTAEMRIIIQKMMDAKLLDKGLVSTYLHKKAKDDWVYKRLFSRLLSKIDKNSLLKKSNLFLKFDNYKMEETTAYRKSNLLKDAVFLTKMIVVTNSQQDLQSRVNAACPGYFERDPYLCYRFGKKKGEREAAVQAFTEMGMTVVDLVPDDVVKVTRPRKPKAPFLGWVTLGSMCKYGSVYLPKSGYTDHTTQYLTKPEFVVYVEKSRHTHIGKYLSYFPGMNMVYFVKLAKMWGDKGVIVNTLAQYNKCRDAGAIDFLEYAAKRLGQEITNDPEIMQALACRKEYVGSVPHVTEVIDTVISSKELKKYFHKKFPIFTELNYTKNTLMSAYLDGFTHYNQQSASYQQYHALTDGINADPNLVAFWKLMESPVVAFINFYTIEKQLENHQAGTPEHDKMTKLFDSLFEI